MLDASIQRSSLALLAVLLAIAGSPSHTTVTGCKGGGVTRAATVPASPAAVEKDKKKHNSSAAHEGTIWQEYLP